jgi:hypothetical protein
MKLKLCADNVLNVRSKPQEPLIVHEAARVGSIGCLESLDDDDRVDGVGRGAVMSEPNHAQNVSDEPLLYRQGDGAASLVARPALVVSQTDWVSGSRS